MSEKSKHIISLIDSQPLTNITANDLAIVRAHSEICASCRDAFAAAQISLVLLKEGASQTFEPPPFFQTKVLAALRERESAGLWAWSRIWKATGALASSMAATVALLAVLTFVLPGAQTVPDTTRLTSANGGYSAEEVILDENDLNAGTNDAQASDGQVLNALYEPDNDTEK